MKNTFNPEVWSDVKEIIVLAIWYIVCMMVLSFIVNRLWPDVKKTNPIK